MSEPQDPRPDPSDPPEAPTAHEHEGLTRHPAGDPHRFDFLRALDLDRHGYLCPQTQVFVSAYCLNSPRTTASPTAVFTSFVSGAR